MNLIKQHWTKKDGEDFQKYLITFARDEKKQVWEKKIVNTKLSCLAVLSKDIKSISNEIAKGNYLSFLDLKLNENLTNSLINANLISKIKDFDIFKTYLKDFVDFADNWASIDTISFNIKGKEVEFLNLAKELLSSQKPFVRRTGVRILFKFLNDKYVDEVCVLIKKLYSEKEYYVNMAVAWLVCEGVIKQREEFLELFQQKALNDFVTNKAISKCHDSFRVTKKDKEYLSSFRR